MPKPNSRKGASSRQSKKSTTNKIKRPKSPPKAKIKKLRKVKPLKAEKGSTRDLKKLRRDFSRLKKLGLIKSKKNARSIKTTDKTVKKQVSELADVLSGKAKSYKITRAEAKKFKEIGAIVKGDKLILPIEKGVKIQTQKGKVFRVQDLKGGQIRSQVLPVPYHNLRQYLTALKNDPALETLKPTGARWAFRFYGFNSYATFADLDLLIDYLDHYQALENALTSKSPKAMREIYQNLEIVTVKGAKNWKPTRQRATRPVARRPKKRSEYSRSYRDRLRVRQPKKFEELLEKERVVAKKKYRKLKRSPKKYKEYLAKKAAYMREKRK